MLIPSIDLMDGKAVQLRQGREKMIERNDVLKIAKQFSLYGEIAVIDLDAAMGKGNNLELIKKICRIADCRVGGGIRTVEGAKKLLAAGAKKIIIGTRAEKKFISQLPKDRIIIALDCAKGNVVREAWKSTTDKTPLDVIKETEDLCSEYLFTDVENEGMMRGIDIDKVKSIKSLTRNKITAAGGINSIGDIINLEDMGINSQLGMAIYTGKIDLTKSFLSLLDFNKNNGLIPTIVQDERGQVLMMAFSTEESLNQAFQERKAAYYSRSRDILWTKGETSGNIQELIKVRYDCDRDTLLFTVRQEGFACHEGSYSCFGDKTFSLYDLYGTLKERLETPKEGSYTSGLDENRIKEKIMEEAEEIINYDSRENLIWEIADISYFLLVLMAKKGITIDEVRNELWKRRR
ncbi:MAG: bifunctional phosphoribosyl-AMP cyclohydrolase/phosphoribosyl-ATP diphosphatase HisIE [Nanoarchaeota archaeon]|nr:bifunctional phosphoribosyl-AMP cyclohydrolase/phosphoribosyl-ATP diphosphatase HisIE [Nanoarchaeota archaeon]